LWPKSPINFCCTNVRIPIRYKRERSPATSSKAKTIAFSAAALLAFAGGGFACIPSDQGDAANAGPVASLAQTAAEPGASPVPAASDEKPEDKINAEAPVTMQTPVAATQPPAQPASRAQEIDAATAHTGSANRRGKLQKAAEQESNF
jgi:hypothetical protein